jgi:hypothetical protein
MNIMDDFIELSGYLCYKHNKEVFYMKLVNPIGKKAVETVDLTAYASV